ncbi:MAG: acyl carrier protein [Solirubrobacteraceae bacterium]|jgi:acyl carrier protein
MSEERKTQIRRIIGEHARLHVGVDSIGDADDLYVAGMTSHASVNLMLALEDAFDLEFPDSMLRRGVFTSVDSIAEAIGTLQSA